MNRDVNIHVNFSNGEIFKIPCPGLGFPRAWPSGLELGFSGLQPQVVSQRGSIPSVAPWGFQGEPGEIEAGDLGLVILSLETLRLEALGLETLRLETLNSETECLVAILIQALT